MRPDKNIVLLKKSVIAAATYSQRGGRISPGCHGYTTKKKKCEFKEKGDKNRHSENGKAQVAEFLRCHKFRRHRSYRRMLYPVVSRSMPMSDRCIVHLVRHSTHTTAFLFPVQTHPFTALAVAEDEIGVASGPGRTGRGCVFEIDASWQFHGYTHSDCGFGLTLPKQTRWPRTG